MKSNFAIVPTGLRCSLRRQVCRKCAVRFGPMCAKVRLFNTTVKRFRAGLAVGKLLICIDESRREALPDPPTLNQ